jgi:hypothetical protein
MTKRVIQVDKSLLEPKVWILTLECQHVVKVTSRRKPTRKQQKCYKCRPKRREE